MASLTIATTPAQILNLLQQEDVTLGDLTSNPIKDLFELKEVKGEFNPQRYNVGGALFVSQPLLTLDWDDNDKQEVLLDVQHFLKQDIQFHPTHVWEIQETRHGYHAVLLTPCEVPEDLIPEWGDAMGVDKLYLHLRKKGCYDWRISQKYFTGDIVCIPHSRVGEGYIPGWVEDLLEKYYTAVQWCKNKLKNDPLFLRPEEEEIEVGEYEELVMFLNDQFSDWEPWALKTSNPITGKETYQVQVYKNLDDLDREWWTKVHWSPM